MKLLVKSDFWLGILILGGGFWAYFQSRGFDEHSSGYPGFLALIHVVIGVCLLIKAVRDIKDSSDSVMRLFQEMRGPIVIAAMLMGWGGLLLSGAGFLLSSIIILPIILYSLGYRGTRRLVLTSICIVSAVFVLFYVLFEVPLPLHSVIEQLFN